MDSSGKYQKLLFSTVENDNSTSSSEARIVQKLEEVLIKRTIHFCQKMLILSRDLDSFLPALKDTISEKFPINV